MTVTKPIEELYHQRGSRARALHDAGKKVIGYFCCFVPDEILTAFDLLPVCPQLLQPGAPGPV